MATKKQLSNRIFKNLEIAKSRVLGFIDFGVEDFDEFKKVHLEELNDIANELEKLSYDFEYSLNDAEITRDEEYMNRIHKKARRKK